ncbi:hypothetical protein EMPS_07823 [Entomortierella parvispora]|uniref:Uncharacterized protein n=1 Tax=Entomortierella parvispora TaxID=205924 RepID=A0A9P3HEV6_9FUNG|nr:hypothetical protein EMPS_07823 [Entomortierella parvispora]
MSSKSASPGPLSSTASTASTASSPVSSSPSNPARPSKRPLAKRCCLSCRSKKARCELPDLFVPSSQDPVSKSKRCHRCCVLDLDCIVWDGDRKRKPKLPPRSHGLDEPSQDSADHTRQETSWNPLAHLASATEDVARQSALSSWSTSSRSSLQPDPIPQLTGSRSSTPISSLSSLIAPSPHSKALAPTVASDPFFHVPPEIFTQPSPELHKSLPTSADTSTGKSGHDDSISGVQPSRSTQGDEPGSTRDEPGSAGDEGGRSRNRRSACTSVPDRPFTSAEKEAMSTLKSHDRTWRSVWRPISVLVDYAAQQPQFVSYLARRVFLPNPSYKVFDLMELIDREECLKLTACMEPYLAWHPHLPSLESLYSHHARQPTRSSLFLLASMCVVAGRHRHPLSSNLMRILSATVDRLGTQILLSGTSDVNTVQALEILLAHEPSLIGTSVCGGREEQASRGKGLAGESLLTAALSISREIGLDKSVRALKDALTADSNKTNKTAREGGSLAIKFVAASLWISLRLWEGHYIFVKSTIRPMRDLNELVEDARCMISIDQRGDRVVASLFSLDKFLAGTVENLSRDNDELLRSAGRTMLAYRIQAMALFQDSMAKIQDLAATEIEGVHGKISLQFRDSIVDMIMLALLEMAQIDNAQQQSMTPFAWHPSAGLVEEWAKLESHTLFSILCTFGTCAIYTGQFDGAFSAKAFMEDLQKDSQLRNQISSVGLKRMDISEKLVASFSFFNRRLNITATSDITLTSRRNPRGLMEATGAPTFLTCALVVDGCRLFLEGAAFILMAYFTIESKSDTKMLLMIQAAQRLDEFDGNIYPLDQSIRTGGQEEAEEAENHVSGDDLEPPLSICKVAAKHVREMAETIQKWKLACSIYRRRRTFSKESFFQIGVRDRVGEDHTGSQGQADGGEDSSIAAPAESHHSTTAVSGATTTQATLDRESRATDMQYGSQRNAYPVNAEPVVPTQSRRTEDTRDTHSNSRSMAHGLHVPHQGNIHYGSQWPSMYPGMAENVLQGYAQAPLAYPPPPQEWPQDADLAGQFGSIEQLLSGSIPDSTQHITGGTVGGIYDLPLLDSFFENLFFSS